MKPWHDLKLNKQHEGTQRPATELLQVRDLREHRRVRFHQDGGQPWRNAMGSQDIPQEAEHAGFILEADVPKAYLIGGVHQRYGAFGCLG